MTIGKKFRTLLVAEGASVLEAHEAALRGRGHRVVPFATAEEAWEACQQERFDLAVLGQRLPAMGGLELCRRIRSSPWGKEAMILVVTEENRGNTLHEILEAGADDYLGQPMDAEELETRITIAETRLRDRVSRRLEDAHYATLFESISDPILVHEIFADGSFGRFTEVNEEACRLFGYPRQELLGMSPLDLDIPGNRVERSAAVEEMLVRRRVTFRQVQVAKNGRRIPVEIRARAQELDGRLVVTAVFRDLTNLREAEEELRVLYAAASASQLGVTVTDFEGKIRFTNRAEAEMHGYEVEELLGREARVLAPTELAHPLGRAEIQELGRRDRESQNIRKDGSIFPVRLLSDLVLDRNGEPIAVITTCEDITGQRHTREIIVRSPAVAFVWKNVDGWPVQYVSENVEHLFGWTREDLVSGAISYSSLVHPEDLARVSEEVVRNSADPSVARFTHQPYRIVRRDGEVIWIEDMTVIRRGDDGEVVTYEGLLLDVTVRVEAEQELRRAHDELELRVSERTAELTQLKEFSEGILSSLIEGVGMTDEEGRFVFLNPAVAQMLGRDSTEELLGQPWSNMVPPDQIHIGEEARERRVRGESDSYDVEALHSDGHRVPCQISSSPRFERGQFIGTLFVVTDLTERAQAEQALRANMESYRALIRMVRLMADNMPDMIWAKDLDNRYIFANSAMCKGLLIAENTDEPLGKDDMFFAKRERNAHPDEPEWHQFGEMCLDSDDIVLASRKAQRFDELGNVQGEFLALDVFKAPLWDEDGKLIGTVGCGRDVTNERDVAQLYRRGEAERALLSTAIEQASDVVVITDTDGKIQYVNPAFEEVTGYSREQAVGRSPGILSSGEHDREFYRELWETVLAKKVWRGHFVNRRADGTRYEEDAVIHPVCDESGEITNFVSIKRDVTEEALLQARSQQARKMAALGELSSGVAHDFNNLLTVIQGNIDLLWLAGSADERVIECIAVIARATRSAAQLTRGLLAFSRQQILTLKPMDLNGFVADILTLLRRLLPDDVEVEFRPGSELHGVEGDETLLEQVLFNLCNNAAQAMPGGGRITLETANVRIEEDYVETHPWARMGTHVTLSVTDEGVGMDEETRERVLDPFFTTKEEGEGTGLGLSSAYGTIRQHRGAIELESELGVGTKVTLYLPATERLASAVAESPAVKVKPRRGGEAILIVDDLPDLRIVLKALLESQGYSVQAACDGLEALEHLRDGTEVDLVITDLSMPRMGGAELYRNGRELAPELRFIFCSANLRLWEQLDCADDARVSYLEKPFDLDSLGIKVREVLDLK